MADDILTDFDIVWRDFPRHVAKQAAFKAWRKLNPNTETVQKMIEALKWQKLQPGWVKDGGQYVPHFSTWLTGRRWEDEAPSPCARPIISQAERDQVARIRARQQQDFLLDQQEYAERHPAWKPS